MKRISTSLQDCEAILLDSGGTLEVGGSVVAGAPEFTKALRRKRIPHFVLSNKTTVSAADFATTLNALGFAFDQNQLITANRAAIHLMQQHGVQSLFVIGTTSQKDELHEAGFTIVGTDAIHADAVIVSTDEQLNYEKLCTATQLLHNGAEFIATNADRLWMTASGLAPDTGATIAYLEHAAEKSPTVTGKPTATMMRFTEAHTGIPAKHMAIIGDQITSDMQMAQEFGMVSVLVLSGQTSREDLINNAYQPDYIVESISHLTPLFQ
jgi:HAD superfamily hydrolase (TIGR01450 family)